MPGPNEPNSPRPGFKATGASAPIWRLGFFACLVGVLVLSLLPGPMLPPVETGWDKANHAIAYLVLGLLGLRAYPDRSVALFAWLVLFGGFVEVLQAMTGYRYAEWADLLADAVGLLAAALVGIAARLAVALWAARALRGARALRADRA